MVFPFYPFLLAIIFKSFLVIYLFNCFGSYTSFDGIISSVVSTAHIPRLYHQLRGQYICHFSMVSSAQWSGILSFVDGIISSVVRNTVIRRWYHQLSSQNYYHSSMESQAQWLVLLISSMVQSAQWSVLLSIFDDITISVVSNFMMVSPAQWTVLLSFLDGITSSVVSTTDFHDGTISSVVRTTVILRWYYHLSGQ